MEPMMIVGKSMLTTLDLLMACLMVFGANKETRWGIPAIFAGLLLLNIFMIWY